MRWLKQGVTPQFVLSLVSLLITAFTILWASAAFYGSTKARLDSIDSAQKVIQQRLGNIEGALMRQR